MRVTSERAGGPSKSVSGELAAKATASSLVIQRYEIPRNMPTSVWNLLRHVCQAHWTTPEAVLRGSRAPNVVVARRHAILQLKTKGFSYPTIARWLRLHHTSVLYHHKKALVKGYRLPKPKQFHIDGGVSQQFGEPDLSGEWAI